MLKGEAEPKQRKGWSNSLLEFRSGFGEKMKLASKKRWKSLAPLNLKSKSVARFCFFSKLKSSNHGPDRAPVYLNVYDLTPINGYIYWAGLGIFHSGVEVHGVEYAFGAHDYATSGVFEVEPRQCPGFKFKKSIFIGTTNLNPAQVREFMEDTACSYYGNMYHLIAKNCNHFCHDVCYKLTGKKIPKWVNRLAQIGKTEVLCVAAYFPSHSRSQLLVAMIQTGKSQRKKAKSEVSQRAHSAACLPSP
ncbi:hypothetical protein IGI04_029737 [Brassica rapa subsp. trilocularis]|uniref:PPPDE domain-containing protein n=1 Tax=Brassica rapa subsp. trilocularis TaxID=1813537 RepID=A0ABQ7LPK4_BRACM|nr:hypothetical protein IGI04_029737 [Brassica rapa subsp. trilocularis]